ncbi:lipoprotein [Myxococcus stipitatus DSM 14675]|uniref:Lipoprotein n=1 Tax=Myxococcus stipitatus (strain DSM 14675 / JCM 12634 / Mx s8) TaxID=1278073 RepID=L7UNJ5_MYXSD|nr:lipoprotein [Myxococcus stipitatus]AGC49157.1 lipoprotein [Myxococcus stipitatus DSM 14675]
MKRFIQGLSLTSLCFSLMACGASKMYTLPVQADRASETKTALWTCATESGLESQSPPDRMAIAVTYDPTATMYYTYNERDAYTFQVIVDDKQVPPAELDAKFATVRKKGEELYVCAQDRVNPRVVAAAPAQTNVNIQLNAQGPGTSNGMTAGASVSTNTTTATATTTSSSASAAASVDMSAGTCARAVDCYARLAKTVCEGAQDCSFKVEMSGNDEAGCRDALLRVPDMLQPFKMIRPNLSAPAVCRAE